MFRAVVFCWYYQMHIMKNNSESYNIDPEQMNIILLIVLCCRNRQFLTFFIAAIQSLLKSLFITAITIPKHWDWLIMTFCETEPFRWVLKHYSDGYTFLAENTDVKGSFCFNDINWPDNEFEWQMNLDCSLDSIDFSGLKAAVELYNSTISNRPSLKDELIDTW